MLARLMALGAGLGFAAYRLFRDAFAPKSGEAQLRRADMHWLAIAIAMGGLVGPVLLMLGVSRTTASSAALLLNMEGLATMAIAWVVFRENADRRLMFGTFAILAGAALLSWDGRDFRRRGRTLVDRRLGRLGVDNNFTRKISASGPVVIAMLKGLMEGAVDVGLALLGAKLPGIATISGAGLVGLLGVGRPRHVHPGFAPFGQGAHRRLLFSRPLHRRHSGYGSPPRTDDIEAGDLRFPDRRRTVNSFFPSAIPTNTSMNRWSISTGFPRRASPTRPRRNKYDRAAFTSAPT